MNVEDFKRFVRSLNEDGIRSDEPHVSIRCEENSISIEFIKRTVLDPHAKLIRIVEDRPKVYKIYYFISKRRELKLVVDLLTYGRLNIRTVKVLNHIFRIKSLARRRF